MSILKPAPLNATTYSECICERQAIHDQIQAQNHHLNTDLAPSEASVATRRERSSERHAVLDETQHPIHALRLDMRGKVLSDAIPVNDKPAAPCHELHSDDLHAGDHKQQLTDTLCGVPSCESQNRPDADL